MEYLQLINNYKVWIGQTVHKPGGGTGIIQQVKECDGIGPDRHTIEGVMIDGQWYTSEQFVAVNGKLALPKEITGYTSQGADGEDWIA